MYVPITRLSQTYKYRQECARLRRLRVAAPIGSIERTRLDAIITDTIHRHCAESGQYCYCRRCK